ncbi:hypothetical protein PILCRDRAFT_92417 [Piloderma croceum F 1598]|uniref:Uncharacterized protein n=1 Tax=Piloderma croceum (strain F 1598) TaxID=765440 RepID=A0A0C3ALN1_PILCF|nr:hypothetical protein PILCRDRAFT_92417 [Piloderma croceum F 1598]
MALVIFRKGRGHLFSSRLKKALVMQVKHKQAFVKFNATFPPAMVEQWEKMVAEWDCDKTKQSPYAEPIVGTMMTDIWLELANEEIADVSRGHKTNISALSTAEEPETVPLFLPSSIPSSLWYTSCASGLIDKERRLRLAQADDGLNELRRQLCISATLHDYKKVQVGGQSQKSNTQTWSLMSHFHDKTMCAAKWYSAAYKALSLIDLNGKWTTRLKYLDHNKDLRSPRCNDDDGSRETTRELSWIWLVLHKDGPLKDVASPDKINDTYAAKQAAICRSMVGSFATCWYPTLEKEHIPIEWPSQYILKSFTIMEVD